MGSAGPEVEDVEDQVQEQRGLRQEQRHPGADRLDERPDEEPAADLACLGGAQVGAQEPVAAAGVLPRRGHETPSTARVAP